MTIVSPSIVAVAKMWMTLEEHGYMRSAPSLFRRTMWLKGNKRALGIIDAENDFGSPTHTDGRGNFARLAVEGGEDIGHAVRTLQHSEFYAGIFASKDWHSKGMFNFAEVNPGIPAMTGRVKDSSGRWATVYPEHCLANMWGSEFLPGIDEKRIDRVFFKGTSLYKDHYSVVAGNKDCVKWLRKQGSTHIDLCGLVFRICVGYSAIDLAKAGFKVRVVVDGCRDLEIPAFGQVIDDMLKYGVEFVSLADVLAGK